MFWDCKTCLCTRTNLITTLKSCEWPQVCPKTGLRDWPLPLSSCHPATFTYYPPPSDNTSPGLNHTHRQAPADAEQNEGGEREKSALRVWGSSFCWLRPAAQTVCALGPPDLRQPLSRQLGTQVWGKANTEKSSWQPSTSKPITVPIIALTTFSTTEKLGLNFKWFFDFPRSQNLALIKL